ncbi:alpha/beta fold hydrolase [Pseudochryseolinea flava]|uniref:AB hydrolase-1 domain-containing protein n=1 Tax=Pseudochryseolinea flava TaxID=2059302 RepID=A0A364Y762_9BACT|nr:alpha/beta hydrolase [Pseudochryseolinea flava]RAW02101.1 hypothetical protein DQQ10_05990 [Pseudochryseolinea flava]
MLVAPAYLRTPFSNEERAVMDKNSQQVSGFISRSEVNAELAKNSLLTQRKLSSIEETSKFRIMFASRFLYDVSKWRRLREGGPFYNATVDGLVSKTMPASEWNYYQNFQKSSLPVSVIIGDHDFLDMGAKLVTMSSKGIPGLQVTVVPQAGHNIWIDQPTRFREALASALNR